MTLRRSPATCSRCPRSSDSPQLLFRAKARRNAEPSESARSGATGLAACNVTRCGLCEAGEAFLERELIH